MLFSSLKEAEKPYCERLHRIKDLMQRSKVSIEEVISELGQYHFHPRFDKDFFFFIFKNIFVALSASLLPVLM